MKGTVVKKVILSVVLASLVGCGGGGPSYKLLQSGSNDDLNTQVNDHLQKGWRLYGSPATSQSSFVQAVVK